MRSPGKTVYQKWYREFESLHLRNNNFEHTRKGAKKALVLRIPAHYFYVIVLTLPLGINFTIFMITSELIAYVKQQIAQGVSRETITQSLLSAGWQSQDVEDALRLSAPLPTTPTPASAPISTSPALRYTGRTLLIVGFLIFIVVGVGAYLGVRNMMKGIQAALVDGQSLSISINEDALSLNGQTHNSPPSPISSKTQNSINYEVIFADKLDGCTPYLTNFVHPLTGEGLTKEIIGAVSGICTYREQMPGGGVMTCKYNESERVAAAQYYKSLALSTSSGTSVKIDALTGTQTTTYTINGKVVTNPLQTFMDTGVCVISGY